MAGARDQAARIVRPEPETAEGDPARDASAVLAEKLREHLEETTRRHAETPAQPAADKPVEAQGAPDAAVVSSDQLNDVDRALQQNPATQTVAMAVAKPSPAASPSAVSGSGRTMRAAWSLAPAITASPLKCRDAKHGQKPASPSASSELTLTERFGQDIFSP